MMHSNREIDVLIREIHRLQEDMRELSDQMKRVRDSFNDRQVRLLLGRLVALEDLLKSQSSKK